MKYNFKSQGKCWPAWWKRPGPGLLDLGQCCVLWSHHEETCSKDSVSWQCLVNREGDRRSTGTVCPVRRSHPQQQSSTLCRTGCCHQCRVALHLGCWWQKDQAHQGLTCCHSHRRAFGRDSAGPQVGLPDGPAQVLVVIHLEAGQAGQAAGHKQPDSVSSLSCTAAMPACRLHRLQPVNMLAHQHAAG